MFFYRTLQAFVTIKNINIFYNRTLEEEITVNQKLIDVRTTLKLTQEEAAQRAGLNRAALSKIENGKQEVPLSLITFYVRTLKVSADWILTGEGVMLREPASSQSNTATGNANTGINYSAGRDVRQAGKGADCEQQLAAALMEIEYLKQRLQDKEQIIALISAGRAGG